MRNTAITAPPIPKPTGTVIEMALDVAVVEVLVVVITVDSINFPQDSIFSIPFIILAIKYFENENFFVHGSLISHIHNSTMIIRKRFNRSGDLR